MSANFLDTGYLLALELSNDRNHEKAMWHWKAVLDSLPPLVTTSYVFDEVITFFNSRGHHKKAVQVGGNLLRSPSIQFIHVDEKLFFEGWRYFQRHQDKTYSLTDCISFVVMEKLDIETAYTFDKHFE
uniref:Predicted nucleic acid-binding protein, contains PIN domain n=1 Tax=Candidatus Kentrum sp. FW TaxID=2126338 RepID=A0A450TVA8_9GAMM|nr:MAG: Predicted nucleic acid-binding protein, contains PIN domain [Candidatus Kentron sp. FW]